MTNNKKSSGHPFPLLSLRNRSAHTVRSRFTLFFPVAHKICEPLHLWSWFRRSLRSLALNRNSQQQNTNRNRPDYPFHVRYLRAKFALRPTAFIVGQGIEERP